MFICDWVVSQVDLRFQWRHMSYCRYFTCWFISNRYLCFTLIPCISLRFVHTYFRMYVCKRPAKYSLKSHLRLTFYHCFSFNPPQTVIHIHVRVLWITAFAGNLLILMPLIIILGFCRHTRVRFCPCHPPPPSTPAPTPLHFISPFLFS